MWANKESGVIYYSDEELLRSMVFLDPEKLLDLPFMESKGFLKYQETTPPTVNEATQKAIPMLPKVVAGEFKQRWQIIENTPPAGPSPQELAAKWLLDAEATIKARLDAFAQERQYFTIDSLVSYVGDPEPKFDAEARYGREVRSAVYVAWARMTAEAEAGIAPLPSTFQELLCALPEISWTNAA